MKLLKIIQTVSPYKAQIIDQITDFHPAYGVELGWSWYTGGMKDTGDWYIDKLAETPIEELIGKLNQWVKEKEESTRKQKEFNEWWKLATPEEQANYQKEQRKKEKDAMNKIIEDRNNYLMWGTKSKD